MTRLFVGTLKGVAFEWFRKLESGSIKSWIDLEKLFLTRFFDDDTEVSMATLMEEKQKKGESISDFVKRFRNKSLHCRDTISESSLLEMCRNNISIRVLSRMGAVKANSWKELVSQGEQIELVLKRVDAEEPHQKKEAGKPGPSRPSKGKDTLAVETVSPSKASPK
jgi:hypothetical protein